MSDNHSWQDNEVVSALEEFHPQPSQRFYQKMQSAPWMAESTATHRRSLHRHATTRRAALALAVLATFLMGGAFLAAPPLRSLAQELLGLFTRQPSDLVAKQQLEADSVGVQRWETPPSLAEVERATGTKVWTPRELPAGYRLEHVGYTPAEHTIVSRYVYEAAPASDFPNDQPPMFVLAQLPVAHAKGRLPFKVGASAPIEVVAIGDTQGEYVKGAWTAGSSEDEQLQWRDLECCRTLRWQRGELVFTLEAHSDSDQPGFLGREEMIRVATLLRPAAEK